MQRTVYTTPIIEGERYWIAYLSLDNEYTERFVQVERVYMASKGVGVVIAYCEMRGERRCFRLDCILDCRSCAPPAQPTFREAAVAAWWAAKLPTWDANELAYVG